jgi:hypothetical protein
MLKNQLLQQAQAKIDGLVTDKERYTKLVSAGVKTIYDKGIFAQLSKALADSQDPVSDVAKGIVSVIHMMAQKARGTIPHEVALQAGMALLLDALDFIEQAGMVKVDGKVLDQATQEFIEAMMPSVGVPQEKMDAALASVKATMADPDRMAQYKASMGEGK